jgi:hypothetical protein
MVHFSTLNAEAAGSSEAVNFYQATQHYIPEDSHLQKKAF